MVRFDTAKRVSFASLQGKLAAEMGFASHAAADDGTMVLLRESDGKVFTRSDALIELARALGGGWRIFALARFIPKPVRDRVYRWVADHRFLFMGKSEACSLPDPELLERLRD